MSFDLRHLFELFLHNGELAIGGKKSKAYTLPKLNQDSYRMLSDLKHEPTYLRSQAFGLQYPYTPAYSNSVCRLAWPLCPELYDFRVTTENLFWADVEDDAYSFKVDVLYRLALLYHVSSQAEVILEYISTLKHEIEVTELNTTKHPSFSHVVKAALVVGLDQAQRRIEELRGG